MLIVDGISIYVQSSIKTLNIHSVVDVSELKQNFVQTSSIYTSIYFILTIDFFWQKFVV